MGDNPLEQDVHPLGPTPGLHQSACCLLRAWGNNRRGRNCKLQLVDEAGKTISFDVCPQVAWWCKMTHQPGGGFGRTPPGSAPGVVHYESGHSMSGCVYDYE